LDDYCGAGDSHFCARSSNGGIYSIKLDTDKPLGCVRKIDDFFENLSKELVACEEKIRKISEDREVALTEFAKGNEYLTIIDELELKLLDIDLKLA